MIMMKGLNHITYGEGKPYQGTIETAQLVPNQVNSSKAPLSRQNLYRVKYCCSECLTEVNVFSYIVILVVLFQP